MRFLSFSFFILLSMSALSYTGTECFSSSYNVEVLHQSSPFGLLTKTLSIEKKECEIQVSHNQYKYHNRSWEIDICRDPIHIKETSSSVSVYRKSGSCDSTTDEFCKEYKVVRDIIEDDGLIFAEGAKNSLSDAHGKVYCTKVLLDRYLYKSIVFNRKDNYDSILKNNVIIDDGGAVLKAPTSKSDSFEIDEKAGPGSF